MKELVHSNFEGDNITALSYKGKPAVIAKQIGKALGYAQGGKQFVTNITREWANEFSEEDYVIVSGEELSALKRLGVECIPSRAPSLLLLFEDGLTTSFLLTKKDKGTRLRRFLVKKVLPQVFRDGKYDPNRSVVDGEIVGDTSHQSDLEAIKTSTRAETRRLRMSLAQERRRIISERLKEASVMLKEQGREDESLKAMRMSSVVFCVPEKELSIIIREAFPRDEEEEDPINSLPSHERPNEKILFRGKPFSKSEAPMAKEFVELLVIPDICSLGTVSFFLQQYVEEYKKCSWKELNEELGREIKILAKKLYGEFYYFHHQDHGLIRGGIQHFRAEYVEKLLIHVLNLKILKTVGKGHY
jgi:prophage antirepressor-like protein